MHSNQVHLPRPVLTKPLLPPMSTETWILHNLEWPGSHHVAKGNLELLICPPLLTKCWDYRLVSALTSYLWPTLAHTSIRLQYMILNCMLMIHFYVL